MKRDLKRVRHVFKRLGIIFLFVALTGLGLLSASFWLIPKDRLNAVIATQLSEAFGYDVILNGAPEVHLFPYLSVSFGPLKVASQRSDERPLMMVERANGRLSVTSLWEGKPALRYIEMEKADIFLLKRDGDENNWSSARFFLKDEETKDLILRFPSRLRKVRFKDSKLTYLNASLGEEQTFSNINIEMKGPPRHADFSVKGRFSWHGDEIETDFSLSEPAAFLTGKNSEALVRLSGQWVTAHFKGSMNWKNEFRADGDLEAELSNPSAFAGWLDLEGYGLLMEEKVTLVGNSIFTKEQIDFRTIGIRFKESRGDGRLVVKMADKKINLSGTLAFDDISLSKEEEGGSLSLFVEKLLKVSDFKSTFDLRLSAEKVEIDSQNFENLALGVVSGKQSFLVNIGAASLINRQGTVEGHLNGEIAVKKQGEKKQVSASLILRQAQFDMIDGLFNLNLPLDGVTNITFEAQADAREETLFAETGNLTMKADFQNSIFHGIRFDDLTQANKGQDLALFNDASYQTKFKEGSFEASVNALGIIDVARLTLKNNAYALLASGRVDLNEDKVSMLGKLSFPNQDKDELSLTFGGALSSPIISSIDNKHYKTQSP